MCRYGMYGPYKEKWACFECRKSFKQISRYRLGQSEDGERLVPCPQCHHQMRNMGLDFKAPKQTDIEQWRKVELLFEKGINFSSCGCGGPGFRPARPKDVPAFLEDIGRWHEGSQLGQLKLLENKRQNREEKRQLRDEKRQLREEKRVEKYQNSLWEGDQFVGPLPDFGESKFANTSSRSSLHAG